MYLPIKSCRAFPYLGIIDVLFIFKKTRFGPCFSSSFTNGSIENPVRDQTFFGMKVLVIIGSNYRIRVDHDPVFFQEEIDICVETFLSALKEQDYKYTLGFNLNHFLLVFTFTKENKETSTCFEVLLQVINLILVEFFPRSGQNKNPSLI